MLSFCKDIQINIQYFAYRRKDTLEGATIIQNKKMVDTKL